MQFLFSSLISTIFLGSLISNSIFVAGGTIPSRRSEGSRRREAAAGAINVAGLNVLRTYVCPPCANVVRRQTNGVRTGTITVAIPVGEIAQLWQEIKWIMEQLAAILEAEGLLPSSAVAPGSFTTLTNMQPSASQVFVVSSQSGQTGNPHSTDPVIVTTLSAAPSISTSSPGVVNSVVIPQSTVGEPGPAGTTSPGIAAMTSFNLPKATIGASGAIATHLPAAGNTETLQQRPPSPETTSSPDMIPSIEAPACYATETFDETTILQAATVTATENVAAISTASPTIAKPEDTMASISSLSTSSTGPPTNSRIFVATSVASGSPETTGTSSYDFNSQSKQNVAVYFGQTPVTSGTTLAAQCADPNIDIVVLAFVITNNYQSVYPLINFGAACGGQTSKMTAEAPGLLSCPELAGYISKCQQDYGKKVLLSIGGATSSLSFTAASEASDFANVLWKLFGPPGNLDMDLRPFGNVSIDGFDVGTLSQTYYSDTIRNSII